MSETVIKINELSKTYSSLFGSKAVHALKNLSLEIEKGSIYGLLGPNGAGKTTLIKILLGIVHPTSGTCSVLNEKPSNYKVRRRIGYLPENHKLPEYLTAEGVLKYYGELNGLSVSEIKAKTDEYLRMVKMLKWKRTKVKKFSKGMMQRLGIAQAIMHNPEIIFLDEPTDGVDPIGRKEIRDLLISLKEQGKTIFVNSHLLSEVELISDRIAILNNGELIFEGTVDDLTGSENEYEIITSIPVDAFIESKISEFHYRKVNENCLLVNVDEEDELNKLIDILRENKVGLKNITQKKHSLEDKFISLIDRVED